MEHMGYEVLWTPKTYGIELYPNFLGSISKQNL